MSRSNPPAAGDEQVPLPIPSERVVARAGRLTAAEIRALDLAEAGSPSRLVAWDMLRDAFDRDPLLRARRYAARQRAWAAVNASLAAVGLAAVDGDGYWRVDRNEGAGAARAARFAACAALAPDLLDEYLEPLVGPWTSVVDARP